MLLNTDQKLHRQHSRFSGISIIFSLLSRGVLFSSPLFLLQTMTVSFEELQNTQLSQPFSGHLEGTGANLETEQTKATLYKQNRCFLHYRNKYFVQNKWETTGVFRVRPCYHDHDHVGHT